MVGSEGGQDEWGGQLLVTLAQRSHGTGMAAWPRGETQQLFARYGRTEGERKDFDSTLDAYLFLHGSPSEMIGLLSAVQTTS